VILLLPLAAPRIALTAVVAPISITCALIVAITIMPEQRRAVPGRRGWGARVSSAPAARVPRGAPYGS
jgi:hypothetical protein